MEVYAQVEASGLALDENGYEDMTVWMAIQAMRLILLAGRTGLKRITTASVALPIALNILVKLVATSVQPELIIMLRVSNSAEAILFTAALMAASGMA